MRHTIWKTFIDYEKEEKWLNSMSAKGFQLVHYSFLKYVFEEGKPGEYIYRIQLLENLPSHGESKAYIRFLEDLGVEMVGSQLRWVYFRKKAADGPFELYSDLESKIRHYAQICIMLGIIGGVNLFIGITNYISFRNPMSLINLFAGGLCMIPIIRYGRRMLKLKNSQKIFE